MCAFNVSHDLNGNKSIPGRQIATLKEIKKSTAHMGGAVHRTTIVQHGEMKAITEISPILSPIWRLPRGMSESQ